MAVTKTSRLKKPGFVPPLRYTLTMALLRDGVVTSSPKNLRLYDSPNTLQLLNLFSCPDGQASLPQRVLVSALSGSYFAIGFDNDPLDPLVRGALLSITESGALHYNIFGGDGAVAGSPAAAGYVVKLDGDLAARRVLAVELQGDGQWRVAGSTKGSAGTLDLSVTGGDLYVMAVDDYGISFLGGREVAVGDTIRPTVFAGWLYRITEAGALPATEPEWWSIDGDNAPRQLGTARAVAVRYYRPLAHGPVPVEMI